MPTIRLETIINKDVESVFGFARSIDLHTKSVNSTSEIAISGRTSGLIEINERTRWKAKHFGIWLELEIQIIEMTIPFSFTDVMVDGNFKRMSHVHIFKPISESITLMVDEFTFESPYGFVGKLVDKYFLKDYMKSFLEERNRYLKEFAEK